MDDSMHSKLCLTLLPAVLKAGQVQMAYAKHGVAVETKSDSTPVTLADREAEAILIAALATVAPTVPVVAEEAMASGQRPAVGDTFFLVDPLDGTREFIAGRGEFTINIGLVERGKPVFGMIYTPASGQFFATFGAGMAIAAIIDPSARPRGLHDLNARRIETRQPPPQGLVAIASRSHMTEATQRFLDRFPVATQRSAGSSLKFCLIACGEADIYPRIGGRTCEWDIAAGHAILAAAGGAVTTPDGADLVYGKSGADFVNSDYVAWGSTAIMAMARQD
jgi:3'(2'), 5'-bisphosphate nucleotidase